MEDPNLVPGSQIRLKYEDKHLPDFDGTVSDHCVEEHGKWTFEMFSVTTSTGSYLLMFSDGVFQIQSMMNGWRQVELERG